MTEDHLIDETASFLQLATKDGLFAALFDKVSPAEAEEMYIEALDAATPPTPAFSFEQRRDALSASWRMMLAAISGEDMKEVAADLAAKRLSEGKPLPLFLASFTTAVLRNEFDSPPKKGPSPYANDSRDLVLAVAVLRLESRGFNRTRNRTSVHDSACSIVASAFNKTGGNVTEEAVEKAVRRVEAWQEGSPPPWMAIAVASASEK